MNLRKTMIGLLTLVAGTGTAWADPLPKTIAYYAAPTPYFDDHANDVAQLYDGFFFVIGSWDEGVSANLGISSESPAATDFQNATRRNLAHLREAGATENLLAVSFSDSAPWPSADTLLRGLHREDG